MEDDDIKNLDMEMHNRASPFPDLPNNLESNATGVSENCNERDCFRSLEADSVQEVENVENLSKQREHEHVLFEPSEEGRTRRFGKCNLRKSLAWDNAFFTSEGVLDPEELAVVTKAYKKPETHALPGIQEDLRKSADSNSTLDSDCWTLESLEVDLFEDVRASIKKSGLKCSKAANVAYSRKIKAEPGEPNTPYLGSLKPELASRNKMKPVISSKRNSICKQGSEKTAKEAVVRPRVAIVRSGDQKASLKPPNIVSRGNSLSNATTRRASVVSDSLKIRNITAKALPGYVGNKQSVAVPKKLIPSDSCTITPKSTPSPKSSSSSGSPFSTKTLSTTSDLSYNRFGSTSSDSMGKSPIKKIYKIKTNYGNVNQLSSHLTVKPPRRISQSETESGNAQLSACLMSMSKPSPSISPSNSLDGLSLASSSSTSNVNQNPNNSKAGLHISSTSLLHGGFSLDRDANQPQDMKKYPHNQLSQCVVKASSGTSLLSHPTASDATRGRISSNSGAKCFRPSGLRMPSPKIGFFDAENSVASASNGYFQSHSKLKSGLNKNPSGTDTPYEAIKLKPSKLTKPVPQTGMINFNSHHAGLPHSSASSIRPTSIALLQQLCNLSPKVSDTQRMTKNLHGMSFDVQKLSLITSKESHLNTSEVEKEVLETAQFDQHSDLNAEEHEKKILLSSEGQDHGLKSHVEAMNLSKGMVKELTEKKGSSSLFCVNDLDSSGDVKSSVKYMETLVHEQDLDRMQCSSKPSPLCVLPIEVGLKSSPRTPLSVKYSFLNNSSSVESKMELTTEKAMDKTSMLPFPDKGMMPACAPVDCLATSVELGQKNILKSSHEDEFFRGQKENSLERH